ncbi:MAG: chloride channel protein [Synechococcales cyanobacterium T60_A2020_003]|nr:chloride channel protein [Synechococcales cyanobacterium T60_A2020_003]
MKVRFLSGYVRSILQQSKRLAIFEACVIGVISGLAAVSLKYGAGTLGGMRIQMTHILPDWVALPLVGCIGGGLAGLLVQRLSPEAAGSGIPQVKAALANVPIRLDLRVALVKLLSVMITIGSGFNLGRQGPTVHIGAALAAQMSQWIPTSPEYRRQLLAAGAAAGLAAGFNAPIAGVLFIVEELLHDFSELTLGTAILASFIGAVVSRLLGGQGLRLDSAIATSSVTFSLPDIPFFLILGLAAGLFGALFSRGIFASLAFNRRFLKLSLAGRMAIAGIASGLITVLLPSPFYDATLVQDLIKTGDADWQVAALLFLSKFVLTLIAYGSGAPGGIFAPSLVLGGALGQLVGSGAHALEGTLGTALGLEQSLSPVSTYALAGMGAFFSAITRGPITAIVILFEITTDFNLVLPLMIGSVIAYLIAHRISQGSLYSQLLELSGIRLEDDTTTKVNLWEELTADHVMQRRVETLTSQMPLSEAVQAFSRSHHRGFPVMEQGKLVGIVTLSDLSNPTRIPSTASEPQLKDLMTQNPVCVHPYDSLARVLYLMNRYKLSRLPVTEGQRLVGIITRADIIRAESMQLSGDLGDLGPQSDPSYVVYQTRSPMTGQGRILIPMSNPKTAPELLKLAAAIAQGRNYELECLQVITVPQGVVPSEATVRTTHSRRLLRQAEYLGRRWNIPVHTQIRVAHDPAKAMLETIRERHITLTLMGWKGQTSTPGRVFGTVVDTIIRQASGEVILVKFGFYDTLHFKRWLVPIAGGPNSREALKLLPSLLSINPNSEVVVCQVFDTAPESYETTFLHQTVQRLSQQTDRPVKARSLWSHGVADAIIKLSWQEDCDVIMLGASRDSLLKQVIRSNIPEAIARDSLRTVILVRGQEQG